MTNITTTPKITTEFAHCEYLINFDHHFQSRTRAPLRKTAAERIALKRAESEGLARKNTVTSAIVFFNALTTLRDLTESH